MTLRHVFVIMLLLFNGCVVASDISFESTKNIGLYEDSLTNHLQSTVYKYPCNEVEPYNYNAAYCEDHWDYTCCTWYVGWGCREEWCLVENSCGWNFVDDYCVY